MPVLAIPGPERFCGNAVIKCFHGSDTLLFLLAATLQTELQIYGLDLKGARARFGAPVATRASINYRQQLRYTSGCDHTRRMRTCEALMRNRGCLIPPA